MDRVVGTAGHVDHGKSSLVLALTGTDCDRLAEEKRRGMTIELGFAAWELPGGDTVGVVDVPGHERLVQTMVAGAQGVDAVLLVVAADEGVMPQTVEHLAICALLGVGHGVVALTKRDLVDAETLEVARAEVAGAVAATPLRDAPVVPCSARTGEGLEELARSMERALAAVPPRADLERPRLYVDRAFTLPGFGPIVTGTLDGGRLHAGDQVSLLPGGPRGRVRGLQRHGGPVGEARPGMRTAINLSAVERGQLARGMAVVRDGTLRASRRLDVRLEAVGDAPVAVRHGAPLVAHLGTAAVAARTWLLEDDELGGGRWGFAQLRLAAPLVAVPGDRVVLRRPSPAATLAGGEVLDVAPLRHRRRDPEVAAALRRRIGASLAGLAREELAGARLGLEPGELGRRVGAGRRPLEAALRELGGEVRPLGRRWIAAAPWAELRRRSTALLEDFHRGRPLRSGLPREQWRAGLRCPAPLAAELAHALAREGALEEDGAELRLPGRGRSVPEAVRASAAELVELLRARGLDPPGMPELRARGLDAALLRLLVDEGRVVRLGPEVVLAEPAYRGAREAVTALLREHGEATVAQIRDLLGATRRVVVPLLERLDAERVTARDGDLRRLRGAR